MMPSNFYILQLDCRLTTAGGRFDILGFFFGQVRPKPKGEMPDLSKRI
jgi:hypothetical protein